MMNRKTLTQIGIFVVLILIVAAVLSNFSKSKTEEYSFTQFMADAKAGQVVSAVVPQTGGGLTEVRLKSGKKVQVVAPYDLWLVSELREYNVAVEVRPLEGPSVLWQIFAMLGPVILLIAFYYWMMKSSGMGGRSGSGLFGVTNNPAKESSPDTSTIRFADVAGCDEAKAEVTELVDYLKEPSRFQAVGGKIPKGVLLVGQPGTGKTMMAKAIAGEAGVPFFSVSGSDFVQMFVGVGAARVRSMFEEARKKAPCIIYIDEIDSVGRQRSAGGGFGGNDEREQTLNQILVEMDGFGGDTNVIVLASTNRVDILDSALLRPGRFDRQVVVPAPDVKGREQILAVHTTKIPLGPDVRLDLVAKTTPGYVGADLANLVNEAAMMAGRERARLVTQRHFELAADKIVMGPERKSMKMSEDERRTTAYHEAGHAAVGIVRGNDPVHKVSIVPRGRALGVTMQLPQEDRYCLSKDHWLAELEVLMGGRAAEEVFCKKITTGASNDMMRATAIARRMVTEWGMSEKLGPLHYGDNEGRGRSTFGPEIQKLIDSEVRDLIDQAYKNAVQLMHDYREAIEKMTAMLLDKETIDSADVESCFPADIQQRANKQWKRTEVTDIIPVVSNDNTDSSGAPVIVT